MAGPERKNRIMSEKEKLTIAYHEGGHALVGHVLEGTDPIHKISIVARGRALGWTLALPTEDKYLRTRGELEDSMAMLLGGRTAEELVFGEITTGASDDIERCTDIARGMVTQYGMSDKLGPQQLGKVKGEVFLGYDKGHEADYSPEVASVVDAEVRHLIDTAHDRARAILSTHRATLDVLAKALVEKETLEDSDLAEIFGPLDKGTGIAGARARAHRRSRSRSQPELVGADAWPRRSRSPQPAAGAAPEAVPAKRRWWKRARRASPEAQRHLSPWPARATTHRHADGPGADREGRARDPRGDRRGPRPRRPRAHARSGSPASTPRSPPASTRTRPSTSPSPSSRATTRWSWSATSRSTACASTTSSRSAGRRTSPTSPARTGGSPACRRSPGWWRATPGGRRCRSSSPCRSPTPWSARSSPAGVMVIIEAEHLCMSMRGVEKAGSTTVTSAVRGLFRENAATRQEAMRFVTGRG